MYTPNKANYQLVARCFFSKGKAELDNYTKYYNKSKQLKK